MPKPLAMWQGLVWMMHGGQCHTSTLWQAFMCRYSLLLPFAHGQYVSTSGMRHVWGFRAFVSEELSPLASMQLIAGVKGLQMMQPACGVSIETNRCSPPLQRCVGT